MVAEANADAVEVAEGSGQSLSILILNHTYPPDPAAVGQYVADVAEELAKRGHAVEVFTSRRGYEDPDVSYGDREQRNGVSVRRLPLSSFGKRNLFYRVASGAGFVVQAAWLGVFRRRLDVVLITTAPPFASVVGLFLKAIRRTPFVLWLQDLNPEQSVALGLRREDDLLVRLLKRLNLASLQSASSAITLDEYMKRTVQVEYGSVNGNVVVIPPWAHEQHLTPTLNGSNTYRRQLGIEDDQVVLLYAGNHRLHGSMDTFLEAAQVLADDPRFVFVFAGDGLGRPQVESLITEHRLPNIRLLPYQPQPRLGELLGAGDLHLVSMAEGLVGITHTCKPYNAIAMNRPILYIGPAPSHVSELIEREGVGWHVEPGDVERFVDLLDALADGKGRASRPAANGDRSETRFRSQRIGASQVSLRVEIAAGNGSGARSANHPR